MPTINEEILAKTLARCRERNIVIPTFAQQKNPSLVPEPIRRRLASCGMQDVVPWNLFRITWKNEPKDRGGLFNDGNWMEFPPELTQVDARIVGLIGRQFPTGAHKVGAAFGCLVPPLVSGRFDPTSQKAVWPSTGNYCRGGAFDCALLACQAVAILPAGMSRERFDWLTAMGAEVIATPGCESNVKEIYDKCWEIRKTRRDCVIFNQFEAFGNAAWHYEVTGGIIEEVFHRLAAPDGRLAAFVSATGSAGTIAAGDYLRTRFPAIKVVAAEALQCPTLLRCGFGEHRIEGIGDKHVPWIHNVRNTDMVVAVDDEQCLSLMRLFNEDAGRSFLAARGVPAAVVDGLPDLGISSICNLVAAIKTARYFELNRRDMIFLPLTDSMELYGSRLREQREAAGPYTTMDAARHFSRYVEGIGTDSMRELSYPDRKALHNLKYFTWVEQQGKTADELRRLWDPDFWAGQFAQVREWDRLIESFNRQSGVTARLS